MASLMQNFGIDDLALAKRLSMTLNDFAKAEKVDESPWPGQNKYAASDLPFTSFYDK